MSPLFREKSDRVGQAGWRLPKKRVIRAYYKKNLDILPVRVDAAPLFWQKDPSATAAAPPRRAGRKK
jgi:hypothetical protein